MNKKPQDMKQRMATARAHKGAGGKIMKTTSPHPSNTRVKTQTGC